MIELRPGARMLIFLLTACTGTSSPEGKHTAVPESAPIDTGVGDTDTGEDVESSETNDTTETADTGLSRLDTSDRDECELVQDTSPLYPPGVECDRTLPWIQVAAGLHTTCGIKSDGCGQCWGEAMDDPSFAVPGVAFQKIALSAMTGFAEQPHICGLTTSGTLLCWGGANRAGENDAPTGQFVDVATGSEEAWAIGLGGQIVEWGSWSTCLAGDYTEIAGSDSRYGAIRGDRTLEVSGLIAYPFVADGTWSTIAHGSVWACGIRTDLGDAVRCVGATDGDETTLPFGGVNPDGAFIDVCAPSSRIEVCALGTTGTPTCWSGDSINTLMDPPPGPFTQITCGAAYACGLTPEGAIECWGDDHFGETIPPS